MHCKKQAVCAIAVLMLLFASGCEQEISPSSSAGDDVSQVEDPTDNLQNTQKTKRTYTIPIGNNGGYDKTLVLDSDGNEVSDSSDDMLWTYDLDDLATGETRYQYKTKEEYQRDEDGNPYILSLRSLYDADGNQILDWENYDYQPAFGEYVIRQQSRYGVVSADELSDDYHTALYHVPTGEESYPGTFSASRLGDDTFLLCDSWGTILGVVNSEGETIHGFPTEKKHYSAQVWNEYIIASSLHPYNRTKEDLGFDYILSSDFNELENPYEFESIMTYNSAMRGDYLLYRSAEEYGVFTPNDGIIFFVNDGSTIDYFDGELVIIRNGDYRSDENPVSFTLCTNEREEIATGFSWLTPVQEYDATEPAQSFVGLIDGKAVIIDRSGTVIESSPELPDASTITMIHNGLYVFYIETDENYSEGLLGENLEIILPEGIYSSISSMSDYTVYDRDFNAPLESILLRAERYGGSFDEPGNIYHIDILDHTGRLVMDKVTYIYDVGPGRIAIKRGFYIGLIDWNGNWIVKRSIFTNMNDD